MIDARAIHAQFDLPAHRGGASAKRGPRSAMGEPRSLRPAGALDDVRDLDGGPSEDLVLAAQLEERRRLAGELHDALGQKMVALSLGLARLRRDAGLSSDLRPLVDEMNETLQEAHSEIRTVAFLLQPPEGKEIETALRDLATGFAQRAGLAAEVRIARLRRQPCEARRLTLFRILQEALVNIHRHARASAIAVDLSARRGCIVLTVRDDGRGLSSAGVPFREGVGLANMRARLRSFGGDLSVAGDGQGVALTARMPN